MSRPILLSATTAMHLLSLALAVPNPNPLISNSPVSLQQPGGSVNYSESLSQLYIAPTIRAGAHAYFMSSTGAQIMPINIENGVPQVPQIPLQAGGPTNENSYAYAWAVQNSTIPPLQTFSKYDLSRNLFHASFDLITKVPASGGRGPKTPYPRGHYEGQKFPPELPGKIDMYLDENPIGFEMWYRDIVFMLKVLFDAEVGDPEKGELGYFDFTFWCFLNGGQEPHKSVHGFFRPA